MINFDDIAKQIIWIIVIKILKKKYSFYYYILHTIVSWKLQINKSFNKLHLIILQILTFKIL